jgi:hypothetical protein
LFKHIAMEVTKYDRFFEQRRTTARELGHSTYQKVTTALRMLAYGIPANLIDDHLGREHLYLVCEALCRGNCECFRIHILERPQCSRHDKTFGVQRPDRGFPSMLGSIDCMHWSWKNCPAAWHG